MKEERKDLTADPLEALLGNVLDGFTLFLRHHAALAAVAAELPEVAEARTTPLAPTLLAVSAEKPGYALNDEAEVVASMVPPAPCATIWRAACFEARKTPVRCEATMLFNC